MLATIVYGDILSKLDGIFRCDGNKLMLGTPFVLAMETVVADGHEVDVPRKFSVSLYVTLLQDYSKHRTRDVSILIVFTNKSLR